MRPGPGNHSPVDQGAAARDDDRLLWLEAVDEEEGRRGLPARTMLSVVLLTLLAAALVAATLFWLGRRQGPASGAPPELIRAEPGPFKVKPDDPGGLDVAGESETAFATSAGEDQDSQLDLGAVPEAAIERPRPAPPAPPAPPARPGLSEAPVPLDPPAAAAPAPAAAAEPAVPAPAAGGTLVQLGAYSRPAQAEAAWNALSSRFPAIAALTKRVVPASVNGNTVYRLRAAAPSSAEAAAACQILRVAGESCVVVR